MGFFGPVLSFPIIPATTPHRGEGALVCSHERQLVGGTETRNVADVGCSPSPPLAGICPHKCWSMSGVSSCSWWHHSQVEAPSPAPLLLSLPHSPSPSLDPGQPAAGALSSVSLARKMDFLQNFPPHFL